MRVSLGKDLYPEASASRTQSPAVPGWHLLLLAGAGVKQVGESIAVVADEPWQPPGTGLYPQQGSIPQQQCAPLVGARRTAASGFTLVGTSE